MINKVIKEIVGGANWCVRFNKMVMKLTNDTKEVCFYVECVADVGTEGGK